jgi:hypothetical protein
MNNKRTSRMVLRVPQKVRLVQAAWAYQINVHDFVLQAALKARARRECRSETAPTRRPRPPRSERDVAQPTVIDFVELGHGTEGLAHKSSGGCVIDEPLGVGGNSLRSSDFLLIRFGDFSRATVDGSCVGTRLYSKITKRRLRGSRNASVRV